MTDKSKLNPPENDGVNDAVKYTLSKQDDDAAYAGYHFNDTKIINVLLVGRSQTGKSGIIDAWKNPRAYRTKTGYSQTKDPQSTPLTVFDSDSKRTYQLNVIDTPGLSERGQNASEDRGDEQLLKVSQKCIEDQVTKLNCVCLVARAGEVHQTDIDAFTPLIEFLGKDFSENTMMILTHCDKFASGKLKNFHEELKTHPKTKAAFEYCKLGVFYHGLVDYDQLDALYEDDDGEDDQVARGKDIERAVGKLKQHRKTLIATVIGTAEKAKTVAALQQVIDAYEKHEVERKSKYWAEFEQRQQQYRQIGNPRREPGGCAVM